MIVTLSTGRTLKLDLNVEKDQQHLFIILIMDIYFPHLQATGDPDTAIEKVKIEIDIIVFTLNAEHRLNLDSDQIFNDYVNMLFTVWDTAQTKQAN